ncbi:MAG TPA: GNAT family N-acetyltransferase [Nocardioidaceae bacterium]|nr:GNAT family N-acetyltransferase [Nocardioidaceae bacterium]
MIRTATAADVPLVAALEQEIFGVDAWSAALVEQELTGDHRQAWVTDDIGYAVTMTVDDVVDLQRIAVAPAHRRHGVARSLLDTVVRESVGDRMLLEVSAANTSALAFYAAAGFVEIDRRRRYYKDGTDAVVMRLPLKEGCSWNR